MTNMQRVVLVLAFVFAILLGVLLSTTLLGGKGSTGATPPGPSGSSAPSPAVSGAPSRAPSASAAASVSASPSTSPTPTPTAPPLSAATIKFVQLALDATSDTSGTTRSITFTSGPGTVTVKLATQSGGSTRFCLLGGGSLLGCRTAPSGTLTGRTTKSAEAWQVTLRGAAAATPVVAVTLAFPAAKPRVTITNARFDGTATPAYNGLQVVATPRAKGTYTVTASWGGHPFLYEVDLIEQGGPGLQQVKPTSGSTHTSQSFAVTPPHGWMVVLRNAESGFGVTPLTATFTWP